MYHDKIIFREHAFLLQNYISDINDEDKTALGQMVEVAWDSRLEHADDSAEPECTVEVVCYKTPHFF